MAQNILRAESVPAKGRPRGSYRRRGRDEIFVTMPQTTADLDLACRLDREADAELGMGHVSAAERLAHRAAELRGLA
jgi:hypothetical protein